MEEQDKFLSPKHKQMLNLALVARFLALLAIAFYVMRSVVLIFNYQISAIGYIPLFDPQGLEKFISILKDNPYYLGDMILSILSLLLRGVVFYLVLHGLSLGLSMIVETDINYRERKNEGGV